MDKWTYLSTYQPIISYNSGWRQLLPPSWIFLLLIQQVVNCYLPFLLQKLKFHLTKPLITGAFDWWFHKVHIFIEYHSVCPLVRNWDSLNPSLASECSPPPRNQRGRGPFTRLRVMGCGSQFRRLEKKLSFLPTLWMILFLNRSFPYCISKAANNPSVLKYWDNVEIVIVKIVHV
jgi:hypothetical protein